MEEDVCDADVVKYQKGRTEDYSREEKQTTTGTTDDLILQFKDVVTIVYAVNDYVSLRYM